MVSSLTFRYLIHFEFIFVYGVRKCSNFILLYMLIFFLDDLSIDVSGVLKIYLSYLSIYLPSYLPPTYLSPTICVLISPNSSRVLCILYFLNKYLLNRVE